MHCLIKFGDTPTGTRYWPSRTMQCDFWKLPQTSSGYATEWTIPVDATGLPDLNSSFPVSIAMYRVYWSNPKMVHIDLWLINHNL